jgi:hypothetical protein
MRDVCKCHSHYDTQYRMTSTDVKTTWLVKENVVAAMLDVSHGPAYFIIHDMLQLHKMPTRQMP